MKISFILLLFTSLFFSEIKGFQQYNLNDLIFYDPIKNSNCNENNYWTIFNQDTTCYRFLSISLDDTSESETLELILDHDLTFDIFEKSEEILKNYTSNWKNIINIELISQQKLFEILKSNEQPNLKKMKIQAPYNGHLFTNTKTYNNKNLYNVGGYWTKDIFLDNNSFAYALTDDGYNSLINTNSKLGIRPKITIEKKYIYSTKLFSNITNLFFESSSKWVKYPAKNKTYFGFSYGNLQGFTVTNDYLIFHSANDSNPYYGLLYMYSGQNKEYTKLKKTSYGKTGHGNGLTFNSRKNTLLVASANYYQNTLEYNLEDLKLINNYTKGFCGIGYDYDNDLYVGYIDRRVYFINTDTFEEVYSFDLTSFETTQDIEYFNGYVFFVTTNFFAGDSYQKYSFYKTGSNIIYVYNAKFENGKPSKKFGMLEDILYLQSLGELEAVEFLDDKVFFGFGQRSVDRDYPYYFCNSNLVDLFKYTKLPIKK